MSNISIRFHAKLKYKIYLFLNLILVKLVRHLMQVSSNMIKSNQVLFTVKKDNL